MTAEEHYQLRTWSRYDGIYLCCLWAVSFIAFMNSSLVPMFGLLSEIIILATPFFVTWRLRRFRDQGRGGIISFRRALFFLARMFFIACMLFGFVQGLYLNYWDDGQFVKILTPLLNTPEYEQIFRQIGMTTDQYLNEIASISPLEFATSFFVTDLIMCAIMSVIIAALCARIQSAKRVSENR